MSFRNEEIAGMLRRWLERFTPPAAIRENQRAAQDSADALLRVLLKYAPRDEYAPWVNRILDDTEWQMKTRAWPTVNELGAVCVNARKDESGPAAAAFSLDPFEVNARRIRDGKPVGDMWIYGRHAHELVARGLVSESQLAPYRSGLFFQMKDAWGEEAAIAAEADLRRKHGMGATSIQAGESHEHL